MANEFDYVIIGAGSAGCVLADRLSADGRYQIAVIEAGPPDHFIWTHIPLGYGKTFFDKRLNWAFTTQSDPGLGNRADYWPRGKLLGGSSAINAMVWIRGDRLDYEDWARAGNPGWGWNDVLPHFRGLEHNQAGADAYRAQGGPVFIADVTDRVHPLAARFLTAAREAGLPPNADFNGATQEGVGIYQTNTRNGWRVSANRAFLQPAMKRRNVTVFPNTHALRLNITGRTATGVDVMHNGARRTLRARRELILAAGAVGSPQLLQLSGIGPGALLQRLGIDIVHANQNVGAHLQDHVGINYVYRSRVPTLNQQLGTWPGKLLAGADFLLRGRGPLALSLNQGGGFVRTRPGLDRANIQLYFQAISTYLAKSGTRPTGPDPFPGFAIGLSNCVTTSRGEIMLDSPDPFRPPAIRPNSLSTDSDIADVLDGLHLLRRIAAQPAMAEVIDHELAPGPAITGNEAMIEDFRARCGTVYHPSCTCRMGPDDSHAVVDAQLRVHGINALRVADASIFPQLISGNTNAPTMMVASKAAEMILA